MTSMVGAQFSFLRHTEPRITYTRASDARLMAYNGQHVHGRFIERFNFNIYFQHLQYKTESENISITHVLASMRYHKVSI